MIQATIRQILLDNPDIVKVTRGSVYDIVLPRDIVLPCLQMQRVAETIDQHTHARRTRIQIDSYAESHTDAILLADLITAVLVDATGTINGDTVLSIQHANTTDLSDAENRVYRITQDYTVIWY